MGRYNKHKETAKMKNIKAQAIQVVMSDRIAKLKEQGSDATECDIFAVENEKLMNENILFSVGRFLKRVA